ncbi:hypothetical protein Mal52_36830 [Symmachiella dynata]|uniref:Uncharacterized protein n=1 Tax=Symmachiella dynata TaxID=2527995 RepID=A0A517ZRS6_9PLAN|nr:hypothetical protein [Symmachiella dynata]QDU45192.1 hypothetical protein Mal52_36830 [Symmachiella dynata]
MSQSQQQPEIADNLLTPRQGVNLLYILAAGHATCLTVFMRHSFGTHALGRNGVVALLLILFYLCGTEDPTMLLFLWAWLAALIYQRFKTYRVWRSGAVWHSKYDGYPALAMKLPFVRTEGSAKSLEPVFCILAGAALCPWSEAVGAYVFLGFASLLVVRAFETQSTVNRVRAMQDAAIEQRNMASMFRGDFHVNDF